VSATLGEIPSTERVFEALERQKLPS
jgi:hypothetical protein